MQESMQEAESEGCQYLYVYGIVPLKNNIKTVKFEFAGLLGKPIAIVPYRDVAAVVSSYPVLKPLVNETEAMQHAEILKKMAEKTTLIPMAFGNVFEDEAMLKTVLGKAYNPVRACLELIKGKIELGVKVVKPASSASMDTDYNGLSAEILNSLNKVCVKSSKGDNFSDRLLLNYSFLVEKAKFSAFSSAVAKLEKLHSKLKFIYTGPWPPYSFVKIRIRGENVHTG